MRRFVLAVALMLALGATASATIELEFMYGGSVIGTPIIGTSCGTGTCVILPSAVTVGDWTISSADGVSFGPTNPNMTLSSFDATSAPDAAPLDILITDTFNVASSAWTLEGNGTLPLGAGTGTATISAYLGNAPFQETTQIGTLGPYSASYMDGQSFSQNSGSNYMLTEQLTVTSGSGGVKWSTGSSITGTVAATEPGTTLLLSLTMLAGVLFRKKLVA